MGRTTKTETKKMAPAVESGTRKSRISSEPLDREEMVGLVNLLIRRIGAELKNSKTKEFHTLAGDLLKLLALQKEIGPERVQEVTVRWIESSEEASVDG
jgi:hypothetical protein